MGPRLPWAPLLAALIAGLAGLVGLPASRMRGLTLALALALATLAASLAIEKLLFKWTWFGTLGAVVAVAIVYLAGIASPLGALLAGVMVSGGVLTAALGGASSYQFAINGVVLVAAAMLLPDGIVGRLSRPHRFGRVDRLAPPPRPVSGGRPPAGTVVTHE